MKRILITGAGSYIGVSFESYLKRKFPEEYAVDTVDLIDGSWRNTSFTGYDAIFHVAGLAHQKETKENAPLYNSVNCELAVAVAEKAKREGVPHFVFLSSMSVYGLHKGVITEHTPPAPGSYYGKSKWDAEQALSRLQSDDFVLTVLRPPMVYGKGCKGNFQSVIKIVKKSPVFPKINNKRSAIYIDNLVLHVKHAIDERYSGVLLPQNPEAKSTTEMALLIAGALSKKLYASVLLGAAVALSSGFSKTVQKAFGTLVYDVKQPYELKDLVSFEDSIRESV